MRIQKFKQFQRQINESEETKAAADSGMFVEYSDDADKSIATKFAEDIKEQSDSPEAKAELNKILAGADLSAWNDAWESRKILDAGELKKEGGWYFGKGAWRINSSKAVELGKVPSWLSYHDPLHNEILENFFPELKGVKRKEEEEEVDIDSELDKITLPDFVPATADQEELALVGESYKFKHIKSIYEAQEFTTGVPENADDDAMLVTAEDLEYKLMRNYNMRDRFNVMIWGAPGIGKTQLVHNVAKKLAKENGSGDIPVVVVALSNLMPTDLGGVPLLFDTSEDGQGSSKMILPGHMEGKIKQGASVASFLPSEAESMEGILFFDEFNRAEADMLAASLTLLLDRESLGGKYHIPNGWRVWAAGNRGMDGDITSLEPAVASRFLGGHFHLAPSLEGWIEWSRSDAGLYKMVNKKYLEIDGSPQYYVPDEFHAYLLHAESDSAESTVSKKGGSSSVAKVPTHFDRKGEPIKTDFNRFYRFDAKKMTGPEGLATGMATPRNWAAAWKIVFDTTLSQPRFQKLVTDDMTGGDPKRKGIAALRLVMENPSDVKDMEDDMIAAVGKKNAVDFTNYMKLLSKHSDSNGTIGEKVSNIFSDPTAARPLIGVANVQPAEKHAILSLILSAISNKGGSMTEEEMLNWALWTIDVDADGKMDGGEMGAHVKQVINPAEKHRTGLMGSLLKNAQVFKQTGKTNNKEAALKIGKWISLYREIIEGFTI